MSASPANLTLLRRAFVDICAGYSVGRYDGRPLYVKHLSHASHLAFDDLQLRYEEEAEAKGLPRESARLAYLHSKGLWSEAKDLEVDRQIAAIQSFEDGKKSVAIAAVLRQYDKQIADEKAKLTALLAEKATHMRLTVEGYAQQRLNDHYIITNVFADRGLTQPLYSEETFEDLADSEVESVLAAYHAAIEPCSDPNLRRLVVQDFFTSYYGVCQDRLDGFYGKAVCELTYYQVRLGNIARYFKALMEQTDLNKVDPKIRGDPEAIERLFTTQRNTAAMVAEGKVPAGGMSNEEIRAAGLEGKMSEVKEELSGTELMQRLIKGQR